MKCEFCGVEEALPFVCNYCGGVFCPDHRLPEAHQCKGDLTQRRTIVAPPQATFTWSGQTYVPPPPVKTSQPFSRVEIRDIAIAYLGLALAFSNGLSGTISLSGFNPSPPFVLLAVLVISLVAVGPGFLLHELSHKFVARKYGYWAEFRVWPMGVILAFFTSTFGFVFGAPGATYISGQDITRERNGIISVAGPLTNISVALAFVPVFVLGGGLTSHPGFLGILGVYGVYINVLLALFNMIPFMPLDGAKVFAWSKIRWGILFFSLLPTWIYLLRVISSVLG